MRFHDRYPFGLQRNACAPHFTNVASSINPSDAAMLFQLRQPLNQKVPQAVMRAHSDIELNEPV